MGGKKYLAVKTKRSGRKRKKDRIKDAFNQTYWTDLFTYRGVTKSKMARRGEQPQPPNLGKIFSNKFESNSKNKILKAFLSCSINFRTGKKIFRYKDEKKTATAAVHENDFFLCYPSLRK